MGRRATQQSTFTKGELDPDLSERFDLEQYYDSLASAPNSVFHPQGGFSDRGGLQLVSDADVLASGVQRRLRGRMVPVHLTADHLTAINGGLTSNLVDQSAATLFTTTAVTAAQFIVLEIDLGSSQRIDALDLIAFKSELAGADEAIGVEYWTGSAWVPFGDALDVPSLKHIRTIARTRRFSVSPGGPGGVPVTARQWRVVARGAVGIGQLSIGGLRLWREVAALAPKRAFGMARQDGETYEIIVSERNVDVFQRQRYVASIPLGVAGQQVGELTATGGFDTLILFHEMLETPRIVRQGGAGEWDVAAAPFTNVPNLVAAAIFSGDQDEIQDVTFTGFGAGHFVTLLLGDLIAAPFAYTSAAALPGQVAAALGALPGLTAADLVCELIGTSTVRVRFAGANGGRAWPLVSALSETPGVTASTAIVQDGLDKDGTYFSASTGWPRCGVITQQRLMLAGFRAAPTSYRFSRNPDFYSFLSSGDPLTADLGFGGALDVDEIEVIQEVFRGRHLQIFTDSTEWYTTAATLSATAPAAFEPTTGNGIARGVPVALVDEGSLFVQKGGETVVDYRLTEAETSYTGDPLSLLAAHLLKQVVDVAHRRARSVRDGNLVLLINADGTAAAMTTLRKQRVIAGAPWSTAGLFRRAFVSADHDLYVVVERNNAHWLEKWVPDVPLDWATRAVGAERTVITGAGYLEGRTDVWAIADGEVEGPFTVTGGQFTLATAAADVTFGLLPPWSIRSQVLKEKIANAQPFRGPARIYEMTLSLKSTGHLRVGTNGAAHVEVSLLRMGDRFDRGGPLQTEDGGAPGLPMYQRLYTGDILVSGLTGFTDHPYWELSRAVPAPVHIKATRIEVVHKGDQ